MTARTQFLHTKHSMSCIEHTDHLSVKNIIFWSIQLNLQPGFPIGHIRVEVEL